MQEMISTTIVALHLLPSSSLGLLATKLSHLCLSLDGFFHDLDRLDGPPKRAPLDLHHITLFLVFYF